MLQLHGNEKPIQKCLLPRGVHLRENIVQVKYRLVRGWIIVKEWKCFHGSRVGVYFSSGSTRMNVKKAEERTGNYCSLRYMVCVVLYAFIGGIPNTLKRFQTDAAQNSRNSHWESKGKNWEPYHEKKFIDYTVHWLHGNGSECLSEQERRHQRKVQADSSWISVNTAIPYFNGNNCDVL